MNRDAGVQAGMADSGEQGKFPYNPYYHQQGWPLNRRTLKHMMTTGPLHALYLLAGIALARLVWMDGYVYAPSLFDV